MQFSTENSIYDYKIRLHVNKEHASEIHHNNYLIIPIKECYPQTSTTRLLNKYKSKSKTNQKIKVKALTVIILTSYMEPSYLLSYKHSKPT